MSEPELRRLSSPGELRECEDLQIAVWGYTEREVVPKNELLAALRSGGSLIGAVSGGKLVGFAYGMAGLDAKGPFLSSRLLAVVPGLRGKGLGERLKREQRVHALELGYERIRWTQDPLQAANARLNFRKLGAVSRSYVLDYYGTTSSPLHGSLPTDRLEVEWLLSSRRVKRRLGLEAGVDPHDVALGQQGGPAWSLLDVSAPGAAGSLPRPGPPRELPGATDRCFLSVPSSFARILEEDKALALEWRLATRTAFLAAFARGFEVVDFVASPGTEAPGRYVLVASPSP